MISPQQIRGARAMLGMTQADLAARVKLSATAINNIERGSSDPRASNLAAIQRTLEGAGVIFIAENGEGPGVRLRKERRPASVDDGNPPGHMTDPEEADRGRMR